MRSWISLGVLLAVVASLGTWVYLRPSSDRAALQYPISMHKSSEVRRIRIEWNPPPTAPQQMPDASDERGRWVVLERASERWRIAEPLSARADPFQVQRILGLLSARSQARYAATDLARFGLERPTATITVDDERVALGALNTTTREQYVRVGDFVYAVPLSQETALPRDADGFLSRDLFAADETPVEFVLPGFSVTLRDGTWILNPDRAQSSPDERHEWAEQWRRASALRAARYDGRQTPDEIKVGLKGGSALVLAVSSSDSGLVLVRPDEKVQYHFSAEAAKRMLAPPGR